MRFKFAFCAIVNFASVSGILIAGGGVAQAATCADLFLIHSERSTVIGSEAVISGGWVSSNSLVELRAKAALAGDVISGGNVLLGFKAKVEGNITAGGHLIRRHGAVVTGAVAETTVVPECRLQEKDGISSGRLDVTVDKHHPKTLNPGNYGDVKVLPFGKLTLKSGVYNLKSLDLGTKAEIIFSSSGSPLDVNVVRSLRFGEFSSVSSAGTVDFRSVNFYAQQNHDVLLGARAKFRGMLTAPNANILALEKTEVQGALYGKRVFLGRKCRVTLPTPPPIPPIQISQPDAETHPDRLPTVHDVPFDQTVRLELIPGDLLRLTGFPPPGDTVYDRIDLGFDRAQSDTMKLAVSEAGKTYPVTGISTDAAIPYRGGDTQEVIVASGWDTVDVKWGVTKAPRVPNPFAPPIHDLGSAGSTTNLKISEGIFKISRYPATPFNVITLRVETQDGDTLEGFLNAGGGVIALGGMSRSLMFKERGNITLVFDLSFPVRREIAVTWNVENRTPAQRAVPRTVTEDSAGIHAVYRFTQDHMVRNDLALTFPSDAFTDGQAPTLARLEHFPAGVRSPFADNPKRQQGPFFAINGNLAPGKSVTLAVPIPEKALVTKVPTDSLSFMRYSGGVWTRIVPDSVAGGYVWFTTDRFSGGFCDWVWDVATDLGSGVGWLLEAGGDLLVGLAEIIDGLADALSDAYDFLVDRACSLLNPGTYVNLVISTAQPAAWSVPQGNLSAITNSPFFDAAAIIALNAKVWGPVPISTKGGTRVDLLPCAATSEESEGECWKTYRNNADLLFADVLLSKIFGGLRRFRPLDLTVPSGHTGAWNPATAIGYADQKIVDYYDPDVIKEYRSSNVFRFSSTLLSSTPTIISVLRKCNAITTPADEWEKTWDRVTSFFDSLGAAFDPQGPNSLEGTCRELLHIPADLLDAALNSFGMGPLLCAAAAGAAINDVPRNYWQSPHRDAHIIGPSHFFNVFTILMWADDGYKNTFRNHANRLRDEIHGFTGFTHDFYGNGNIPINAMAGVAFWDLLTKGDRTAFNTMKTWLEAKMGSRGGYAEGTGYLQGEINAELPYILSAILRAGLMDQGDLPPKYLESGNWLLNSSRVLPGNQILPTANHALPIEVDDGNVTETDFLSYAMLTGNGVFSQFHSAYPSPARFANPIRYLGLPGSLPTVPAPTLGHIFFPYENYPLYGDIGTVRGVNPVNGDVMTLSIVAESGALLTNGFGHDQQDNTSVTLDHSRYGRIIVDPGYNGFSHRGDDPSFARFSSHNVVMHPTSPFGGEAANPKLTLLAALAYLSGQPGLNQPDAVALFCVLLSPGSCTVPPIDYLAGGRLAILNRWIEGSSTRLPSHGLEVKHESSASVTNRRAVLYFGDYMWIIDRPSWTNTPLQSRVNWATTADQNGFALPSTLLNNAVHFPILGASLPLPLPQGDNAYNIYADQITRTASSRFVPSNPPGSQQIPPVFVTGYPIDPNAPRFAAYPCDVGACFQRITSAAEERVIVPQMNYQFGVIDFIGRISGQIVLARRLTGSQTWTFRLVGEEGSNLQGWSLGYCTANSAADGFYQYIPTNPGNAQMNVILPKGNVVTPVQGPCEGPAPQ